MDERRGSVARVQCGRGGLLHNECAIASFLEGDATIIHLNSTEAAVWFLFLPFSSNIFEWAMSVFVWCGGGSNTNTTQWRAVIICAINNQHEHPDF